MVQQRRPTQQQLRQHALDRAVSEGMVGAAYAALIGQNGTTLTGPAELATAVTQVADVFVGYLDSAEECTGDNCSACHELLAQYRQTTEPMLGLATTRQLLVELGARLRHFAPGMTDTLDSMQRSLVGVDGALDYRTVDEH